MPPDRTPRPKRRGSTLAGWFLGLALIGLALVLLDSRRLGTLEEAGLAQGRVEARTDQLTDPAMFNEARYARHASQADGHAAFQDHPLALEHFPAGSLMPPP